MIQQLFGINQIFSNHTIITYISWLTVAAAFIIIYKTSFGLNLRGTGYYQQAIRSRGSNPEKNKSLAILISGSTCGLAGAQLSLSLGAALNCS